MAPSDVLVSTADIKATSSLASPAMANGNANAGAWSSIRDPALSGNVLTAIGSGFGFDQMTPVQAAAIPLFLRARDVVVEAVTGSGKSLAFLLPIVEILRRKGAQDENCDDAGGLTDEEAVASIWRPRQVGAIVISPTRELAQQTFAVLTKLLDALAEVDGEENATLYRIRPFLLTGGRTLPEDAEEFSATGGNIIVATPGKLETLLAKHSQLVDVRELDVLVLDEADRLLDLGFDQSLRSIMKRLPKQRRTGLFSATMTDGLAELMKAGLRNPARIVVKVEDAVTRKQQRTPSSLTVRYAVLEPHRKLEWLVRTLWENRDKKVLVFFATCPQVDFFQKVLAGLPWKLNIAAIHGKMVAKKRTAVYQKFTSSSAAVLLGTDVAARGLDIPDVELVVQFDPPQDPQAFLHRCGRTARQGRVGDAVVLLHPHEDTYVDFMELRKVPMSKLDEGVESASQQLPFDLHVGKMPSFYRSQTETTELTQFVHLRMLTDRDLYVKAVQSFVSYLKSYKEHQLKYIFQLRSVNLQHLAAAFFLLRLPKCPELRGINVDYPSFVNDAVIERIPYKKKQQEEARLRKSGDVAIEKGKLIVGQDDVSEQSDSSEKQEEKRHVKRGRSMPAWSDKKAIKDKRTERKRKKETKRLAIEKRKLEEAMKEDDVTAGGCSNDSEIDDEWRTMQLELRMKKKMKSGKITKDEYESAIAVARCGDDEQSLSE